MTITAAFDSETTGIKVGDHRLVEVYIGLYRNGALLKELNTLIDPQRSIPADVQAVHGITPAMVAGKPTWEKVAPMVQAFLAKADIWMAHNAEFDIGFFDYELKRLGLSLPKDKKVIDTMAFVWATPDGKKPTLKELCVAVGITYDTTQSHRADYDVKIMMEAYERAVLLGFAEPLPASAQVPLAA